MAVAEVYKVLACRSCCYQYPLPIRRGSQAAETGASWWGSVLVTDGFIILHYGPMQQPAGEIGRVHCSVLQLSIQCSSILIISREGARRRVESPYPYLLLSKFTHHSYKFFKCESTHRCFQQGKGTIGHIPKMLRISMHDLRGIVRCSLLLVQLWWKWWMLSAQCW